MSNEHDPLLHQLEGYVLGLRAEIDDLARRPRLHLLGWGIAGWLTCVVVGISPRDAVRDLWPLIRHPWTFGERDTPSPPSA